MNLFIVRHAEAAPLPGGEDRDRPLTTRGREQARSLGLQIATTIGQIPEIRHSSRLRARETAEIVASQLEGVAGIYPSPGLEPEDDPAELVDELDAEPRSMMIVGHMPFVARLAGMLIGSPSGLSFEPAMMVQLQWDGERWRMLRVLRA